MNRELDIFDVSVRRCRRRFEPGETIKTRHLSQPMDGDKTMDGLRHARSFRIPFFPCERFRIELRVGAVSPDLALAVGEDIELRKLGRLV